MTQTLAEVTSTSPLRDLFPDATSFVQLVSAEVAADFGDPVAEYNALRQEVARIDYSGAGLVEVSGEGAYDLLQSALARDLEFVTPEQSLISALLDPDGHVVDVVTVYYFRDGFRLETSIGRGDAVTAHLSALAQADGTDAAVTLNTAGQTVVLLEGPKAAKAVEENVSLDLSALPLGGLLEVDLDGVQLLVSRTGFTGEFGYKLFVDIADAATLWNTLGHLTAAGQSALEIAMFEVRQPLVTREVTGELTAIQLGYNWMIDITKDSFVGRDAVEAAFEAGSRSEVVGLEFHGDALPPAGAPVRIGGEDVGAVIHAVVSPQRGMIGLARLRPELIAPGIDLEVGDPADHAITITAPYVIPLSWSTR
jgi:aminomethyltransferase